MQKMGNLDFFFLQRELARLEGAFFSKAYELEPGLLRLRFNHKTRGNVDLIVELGKRIHETRFLQETPEKPSHFAGELRRLLNNGRLLSVRQLNLDRILAFELQKAEKFFLVFEMLGAGNALLCDSKMRIIAPYARAEYSIRSIKRNVSYQPPPQEKKPALEAKASDFNELKGKIVAVLSKNFNLSPFYFEEACCRAGVALEEDASRLSEKQKTALATALRSLFENPSFCVYFEEDKPVAFSPIALKKFDSFETQLFPSFSEALDFYFANAPVEAKENPAKKKLEFTLSQQEKAVGVLLAQAEEETQAGDWIYANSALVDELLSLVKSKEKEKLVALAKKHGFKASLEGLDLVLE